MIPDVSRSNLPTRPQSVGKPALAATSYTVRLATTFFGKPNLGLLIFFTNSVGPVSTVLEMTPKGL